MNDYPKALAVQEEIDAGDKACKAVQNEITRKHNGAANRARLSVRQEWTEERKELESLLAVAKRREAKAE